MKQENAIPAAISGAILSEIAAENIPALRPLAPLSRGISLFLLAKALLRPQAR